MFELILIGFLIGLVLGAIGMHQALDQQPSKVLFFPDKKEPCDSFYTSLRDRKKLYCFRGNRCMRAHGLPFDEDTNFIEILRELNKATKKIDICMYLITYDSLVSFLLHLRTSRGIKIRVITDSNCDNDNNDKRAKDQAENLSKSGIEIKSNATGTSALMHNKFVIVDDKQLMFGSFNWTRNAILNNHESVMVIHLPDVVKRFRAKFNRLWTTLSTKNFQASATTAPAVAVDFY